MYSTQRLNTLPVFRTPAHQFNSPQARMGTSKDEISRRQLVTILKRLNKTITFEEFLAQVSGYLQISDLHGISKSNDPTDINLRSQLEAEYRNFLSTQTEIGFANIAQRLRQIF